MFSGRKFWEVHEDLVGDETHGQCIREVVLGHSAECVLPGYMVLLYIVLQVSGYCKNYSEIARIVADKLRGQIVVSNKELHTEQAGYQGSGR